MLSRSVSVSKGEVRRWRYTSYMMQYADIGTHLLRCDERFGVPWQWTLGSACTIVGEKMDFVYCLQRTLGLCRFFSANARPSKGDDSSISNRRKTLRRNADTRTPSA